jgi:hypothetical protein
MPILQWNQVTDRTFETGLDRGVIYLNDGRVFPWNGLTSVKTKDSKSTTAVYFDGVKCSEDVTLGAFEAEITAYTYPDAMLELEGYSQINAGVMIASQRPQTFSLSYRTQVGSALEPEGVGYKIHLIYNATAIPSDKEYSTLSDSPEAMEFSWNITTIPEEVDGLHPSAYIEIDSRKADPVLLEELERLLYGGVTANPALPTWEELITILSGFFRVEIIDNRDGTWTATTRFDGYITMVSPTEFQLDNVTAEYLDADTYKISNTQI